MKHELTAESVEVRLARLAEVYVPESVSDGRARLIADEMEPRTFALLVAGRLGVLRSIDELMRYLRPAREALRTK